MPPSPVGQEMEDSCAAQLATLTQYTNNNILIMVTKTGTIDR